MSRMIDLDALDALDLDTLTPSQLESLARVSQSAKGKLRWSRTTKAERSAIGVAMAKARLADHTAKAQKRRVMIARNAGIASAKARKARNARNAEAERTK